jgi:hypothetical protein
MLSAHFSVKDLCLTSKALSQSNYPTTQTEFDNLTYTADALEMLESHIGPLKLLSGFRTKELQLALAAAGDPVAKGTSYHELGLGVDITPTTMPLAEYFGRILADESIKGLFIEIAIKPAQNAIHLGVRLPAESRNAKISGLKYGNSRHYPSGNII